MNRYDVDKSGTFSNEEVKNILVDFQQTIDVKTHLKKLVFALVIAVIVLVVVQTLLTALVVQQSKETTVNNARLEDMKGHLVLTANAETDVVDGKIVGRCKDKTCSSTALSTSQALAAGNLSSTMNDQDLRELRQLTIMNGENWITVQVHSVARYVDGCVAPNTVRSWK